MRVAGTIAGLLLATLLTPVAAAEADIQTAADAADVDPEDLAGAVATTGLDPFEYLYAVGELARPVVAQIPAFRAVWHRLVECEASGNWHAGNAKTRYSGGIQADATFWARYGGLAFAPYAGAASPYQQVIVAERGLAVQGRGAWPICGPRVKL